MDSSSFQQQEFEAQKKNNSFLDSLQAFDNVLRPMRHSIILLAGLFKLTEEEQENAGVYLGRLGDG